MTAPNFNEMTEAELAAYYQAHKGDLSLWKATPRKLRRRGYGPTTSFAVRFTPDELELLQSAARARGVTTSELIRAAALCSIAGDEKAEGFTFDDAEALRKQISALRETLDATEQHLRRVG